MAPVRTTYDAWWPYVARLATSRRHIVVVAPNAAHLLDITHFWAACSAGLFRVLQENPEIVRQGIRKGQQHKPWISRFVWSPSTCIVSAKTETGSLTALSATNYADISPRDLCRCVGVRGTDGLVVGSEGSLTVVEEDTHCFALARWLRLVIASWVSERCGSWGLTAGQLGVSIWRTTDGRHSVSRHDNDEAKEIEAKALHGARASVWFYGEIGDRRTCPPPPADPPPGPKYPRISGRLHYLDVRSMYPWILGHRTFPVQFRGIRRNLTPEQLGGFLRHWGGIAEVRLKVADGEYPLRHGRGTRYPIGTFWTTLAGPELLRAVTRREIVEVGRFCRYRLGEPFRQWSQFVLRKRVESRTSGDHATELLWKMAANAFGGKFAQKSRRWVPDLRFKVRQQWGELLLTDPDSGDPVKVRMLQGIPFRLITGGPAGRLPASVHAYLTSYGRLYMLGIRTVLPPRSVVAQHTDGLWVTDEGLAAAKTLGLLSGDGPGALRLDESTSYARFWDASHYYTSGQWTLAGVASGWRLKSTAVAEVPTIRTMSAGALDPQEGQLISYTRDQRLDQLIPSVPIGLDGWVRPYGPDGEAVGPKLKRGDRGESESPPAPKRQTRRRPGPSILDM